MVDGQDRQNQALHERGNRRLRFLDRMVGIPLLFMLGLFKRKKSRPERFSRIALLKTAAIGDTVLISAIVRDIKQAWPDAHVTFFCGSSNHDAAQLLLDVDEVILVPVAKPLKALNMMRRSFDVMIDFGQWPRLDALLAGLCGAGFTIGFNTLGQYRHYLFDAAVNHDAGLHELDNFRNLLTPLGIEGQAMPVIPHNSGVRDPKLLVIHMFAGGLRAHQKAWPKQEWLQLMDGFLLKGYRLVLTGSAANRPDAMGLAQRVSKPGQLHVAAGELNLAGLVDLLTTASLLITVNTGVMHLAAALHCPLVALNGPTAVGRWGPVGPTAIALQSPRSCSPCLNLGFEYACPGDYCMREISLDLVQNACEEILQKEKG